MRHIYTLYSGYLFGISPLKHQYFYELTHVPLCLNRHGAFDTQATSGRTRPVIRLHNCSCRSHSMKSLFIKKQDFQFTCDFILPRGKGRVSTPRQKKASNPTRFALLSFHRGPGPEESSRPPLQLALTRPQQGSRMPT